MAISTRTMTPEQMKAVVIEYFKRGDRGDDQLALFADDADVYFPKWGVARGKEAIARCFGDVSQLFTSIQHDLEYMNIVVQGDVVVAEGTSSGTTADGVSWRAGVTHAGRFVDWFEIRDFLIQRCFIYVDPDYAGADTERYHWLRKEPEKPA